MSYFEVSGECVRPNDLEITKARDLALSLSAERIAFARFVECRRRDELEVVVFDVDVEIAQVQRHPIKATERISASFTKKDDNVPVVNALRVNFPRVPHLNLHRQEYPRNMCVYEETYEEIKRSWTCSRFVHDIRRWLALNSQGTLHQDDQPLEPLLMDFDGYIVLPSTQELEKCLPAPLVVIQVTSDNNNRGLFLIALTGGHQEGQPPLLASVHRCEPQTHGVIHQIPSTLADLGAMTAVAKVNLIFELQERLRTWHQTDKSVLDANLLVVILFPKMRHEETESETVDSWAFLLLDSVEGRGPVGMQIRQLGAKIGLWDLMGEDVGYILPADKSKTGDDVDIAVLNPVHHLDRSMAAKLNGEDELVDMRVVAIGMGALGSQVAINLARTGFGTWKLIDHDVLLPHNLARHALDGSYLGWNKADAVAHLANTIVLGSDLFSSFPVNVLSPARRTQELSNALAEAGVILDMSASVGVARMLANDCDSAARRISLFLSPSGKDLVLIAEDIKREITVDALEMQYYRAVLNLK